MRQSMRGMFFVVLLGTLCVLPGEAQIGPGPFAAFPSSDPTDGRFLGFGCPGLETFEAGVSLTMSASPTDTDFVLSIFDGETTGSDPLGHWDAEDRQLVYSLYFDPFRQGNTNPADLVGRWFGNAVNPLTNPDPNPQKAWTASSATMPDNAWWGVTVVTAPPAQSIAGGNYFYHLRVDLDGVCAVGETTEANIKIAASNPLNFVAPRFAFVAPIRNIFNDGAIIYPGPSFPPPLFDLLGARTTFDGTFSFSLNVPPGSTEVTLYDGDFDHGTDPSALIADPSGVPMVACSDLDDADTAATYAGFPPALDTSTALPEGAVPFGQPADDTLFDFFRRGEPGNNARLGCVRYEVTDPLGNVYRNDNPSSNREWEQFRIVSTSNADAGDPSSYDHLAPTATLPPGPWVVRVYGLDMSNLNFWYADFGVCSNVDNPRHFDAIDFDRDPAGFLFPAGMVLDEQYAPVGIHFASGTPGVDLQIFNSESPSLLDEDLGTPSSDFGGTGLGAGGAAGQPGENRIHQFAVATLGECEGGPTTSFCGQGGTIIVTFDFPVDISSIELVDIDEDGGRVRTYTDVAGTTLATSAVIPNLGDNSFQRVTVNATSVRRMEIELAGDAALAAINPGPASVPSCPPPPLTLGDTVWRDTSGDGAQQAGEPGITGVRMNLRSGGPGGPIVATMLTGDTTAPNFNLCRSFNTGLDEAGLYCFQVPPGTFTVEVDPSNFLAGGPLAGLTATTASPTQTNTLSNLNVLTYDFGYDDAPPAVFTVGDTVWRDNDRDGTQDSGEPGISGVVVNLISGGPGGPVVATFTTGNAGDPRFATCQALNTGLDTAGLYCFPNLAPGTYTVEIAASNFAVGGALAGLVATTASPTQTNTVTTANILTYDFGYATGLVVGDTVWRDNSGDGVQQAGEPGISGVLVNLRSGGPGGPIVSTFITGNAGDPRFATCQALNTGLDTAGLYCFPNLAPGTYTVEIAASNFAVGGPLAGLSATTASPTQTNTVINLNILTYDFGYRAGQTDVECAEEAPVDPAVYGGSGGHAVWLPGIGTDFIFDPLPGTFVELPDGTARLQGVVRSAADPAHGFYVDVQLSGRTSVPPPGSPKKELLPSAYSENGGPVNTATFHYYPTFSGTLTGIGDFAGAVVNVTRTGPAFQVGAGANNKNTHYGASAWFLWTVVHQPTDPGHVLQGTGQGDFNIDLANCELCVDAAAVDPTVYSGSGGHAVWMPGIATDFVFRPDFGSFVENPNGTATLSGTLVSASDAGKSFFIDVQLSGFTFTAPPGSPKKELLSSAYSENGGPVNTSTFHYYTTWNGTLTGLANYTGAVVNITRTGPAFQVGYGANNKNLNYGGSGWFVWSTVSQPTNPAYKFQGSGQGDINVDVVDCDSFCPPGTGTPGYWKNHPEAWPVQTITIGGRTYTKSQAIYLMGRPDSRDKTYSMFKHLVAAKLNVVIGNPHGCIDAAIAAADAWMAAHPPGSGVKASSSAWQSISSTFNMLVNYNEGKLCAPHRDNVPCQKK